MRAVCASDCATSKFYFWAGNVKVRSTSTIHRIAIVKERRLRARTVVVNNRTLRLKGKNPATGVCIYFYPFPRPAATCVSRAHSRWRIRPLVHNGRRRCVFKFTRTAALERRRDRADRTWYRRRGRLRRWADTTWVRRA